MIEFVHCEQCGGTSMPFGTVSVNIELSRSKFCDECRQVHTEKQDHFFCSVNCFYEFMAEDLRTANNRRLEWKCSPHMA